MDATKDEYLAAQTRQYGSAQAAASIRYELANALSLYGTLVAEDRDLKLRAYLAEQIIVFEAALKAAEAAAFNLSPEKEAK